MWKSITFFAFSAMVCLAASQSSGRGSSGSSSVKAASKASSERFKSKMSTYQCPFDFGLYANPDNCRRFYACHAGRPFDTPCPNPLYFDDVKKLCVFKNKDLVCGPVEMIPPEPTTPDPLVAPHCVPHECHLPDCHCSSDGTAVPANLDVTEVPQMIILAFSGALNAVNIDPFGYILNETKRNPNNCPIKATFFIPHEYTSYYLVQKMYGQGHEIALQSISQREPEEWWSTASTDDWVEEVIGMKEMLHQFSNISRDALIGVRAPYIKPGGNRMMSMIYDYGLDYDSSLAAPASEVPLWPYTMDFAVPHPCISKECPTRSFPGIWEFPMNTMVSEDGSGSSCVLLDQCIFPHDPEVIFDFLFENFVRHFTTNRAPLVLNMHVNFLMDESRAIALDAFIEHMLENYHDVWFVSMQQALEWLSNPTITSEISKFQPWNCPPRQPGCNIAKTCAVTVGEGVNRNLHYMQICGQCPERYPWLGNIRGTKEGQSVKDLVQVKN